MHTSAFLPVVVLTLSSSALSAETSPIGHWARGDGNARVRIEPCGDALCAINTWVRDTSGGEDVGHRLLMRVRATGGGKYSGTAFDPQRDRSYGFTMRVQGNSMSTTGCVLAVLCKSMDWRKIR